jgi:hypothetical protein
VRVHLQFLVGSMIRDSGGKRVGRVEEIIGHRDGDRCLIDSYHVGAAAFFKRVGLSARRLVGLGHRHKPLAVPWQQLDISDPKHPVVLCTKDELEAMQ